MISTTSVNGTGTRNPQGLVRKLESVQKICIKNIYFSYLGQTLQDIDDIRGKDWNKKIPKINMGIWISPEMCKWNIYVTKREIYPALTLSRWLNWPHRIQFHGKHSRDPLTNNVCPGYGWQGCPLYRTELTKPMLYPFDGKYTVWRYDD